MWETIGSIVNPQKIKENNNIQRIDVGNHRFTNSNDIANGLNNYFGTIGESLANKIPTNKDSFKRFLQNKNRNSIVMFPTDFSEITKIISNLKTKTSQGDDNISTKLLKLTSNITSNAIAHITNLSINQGIVPDKLKIAKVIPIFKKNERHEAGNYRPISLLSIINKIMEKVVYSRLNKFLTKFKLFYKYQFGFKKKHSTIHALIKIVENIIMDLENKKHIARLYLDLSKAFDTVNHDILLQGCQPLLNFSILLRKWGPE